VSAEHERLIASLVMVGVVKELDEARALVRVDVDGLVTDWIPFTAARAGPGVRDWSAPEPGEQVVIVCPYGDPSQGVVLGSVYQQNHDAPAALKTTHRIEYADGAFVEYDRAAHAATVDVPAGGSITLHIGGTTLLLEDGKATLTTPKLLVDSPQSTFTGAVTVQGLLTYQAGMSGSGGGTTAAINGDIVVTGGNVTADGIGLKTHKHTGVQSGGGTTAAPVP